MFTLFAAEMFINIPPPRDIGENAGTLILCGYLNNMRVNKTRNITK